MADVQPIPKGREGVIPHLVVEGAAEAIDFYTEAFGAEDVATAPSPDGSKIMHAEFRIGSSIIFLADDFPEMSEDGRGRSPKVLANSPVTIHQYTTDVDAAVEKARAAGATVTMEPEEMFWGERYATLTDPFGHHWSFSSVVREVSEEEMAEAAKQAFS